MYHNNYTLWYYCSDKLEYTEVMMQGGTTHPVHVTIEKCGTAIAWEFSTEPKGIAFGIVYKSTSENSQEYEVCHIMHYVLYQPTSHLHVPFVWSLLLTVTIIYYCSLIALSSPIVYRLMPLWLSFQVLPLKRCSSHKTVLTGEYIAQKAGTYVLKFDNRHSK